jgi:hypothetical protein
MYSGSTLSHAGAVSAVEPEDEPRSVKSGRTNDEVAAAPAAQWRGDSPADHASQRPPGRVG